MAASSKGEGCKRYVSFTGYRSGSGSGMGSGASLATAVGSGSKRGATVFGFFVLVTGTI